MIDPKDFDLPLEEMSFGSKAPAPVLAQLAEAFDLQERNSPNLSYFRGLSCRRAPLYLWLSQGSGHRARPEQELADHPIKFPLRESHRIRFFWRIDKPTGGGASKRT
jgi:hypothetical protein